MLEQIQHTLQHTPPNSRMTPHERIEPNDHRAPDPSFRLGEDIVSEGEAGAGTGGGGGGEVGGDFEDTGLLVLEKGELQACHVACTAVCRAAESSLQYRKGEMRSAVPRTMWKEKRNHAAHIDTVKTGTSIEQLTKILHRLLDPTSNLLASIKQRRDTVPSRADDTSNVQALTIDDDIVLVRDALCCCTR